MNPTPPNRRRPFWSAEKKNSGMTGCASKHRALPITKPSSPSHSCSRLAHSSFLLEKMVETTSSELFLGLGGSGLLMPMEVVQFYRNYNLPLVHLLLMRDDSNNFLDRIMEIIKGAYIVAASMAKQLICPSKGEVMVFGSYKQIGTLILKAPMGWG